eukprot:UN22086
MHTFVRVGYTFEPFLLLISRLPSYLPVASRPDTVTPTHEQPSFFLMLQFSRQELKQKRDAPAHLPLSETKTRRAANIPG